MNYLGEILGGLVGFSTTADLYKPSMLWGWVESLQTELRKKLQRYIFSRKFPANI